MRDANKYWIVAINRDDCEDTERVSTYVALRTLRARILTQSIKPKDVVESNGWY